MFSFLGGIAKSILGSKIVKKAGDFLGGIFGKKKTPTPAPTKDNSLFGEFAKGASGAIGSALGSTVANKTATALFGPQDRVSFADWQHQQNLLDYANPLEINRQRTFLQEMAPAQAAAYNTYQDSVYEQDTARQTNRIQQQASALGMSPWEITGSPGAGPAPAVMSTPQRADPGAMLQSLIPLKVAELQTKGALAQTAMQTDSAQRIAAMQTNNGELAKAQTFLANMQELREQAAVSKIGTDEYLAIRAQELAEMRFVAEQLPTETINLGAYQFSKRLGGQEAGQLLKLLVAEQTPENEKRITKLWTELGEEKQAKFSEELAALIGAAGKGINLLNDAMGAAADMFSMFQKPRSRRR